MKILCLNSGGFDSIVMLYEVRYLNPDAEIHTLIFNYGQKSWPIEYDCAKKSSDKVGAKLRVITIPEFTWSKNYGKSDESSYLEYRNLIFLAYASSYAESIEAEEIHVGWISFNEMAYLDGSDHFYHTFRSLIKPSGITLRSLFLDEDWSKYEVYDLMKKRGYNVTREDFNSCDYLDDNYKPCGKCPDCLAVESIYSENPIELQSEILYNN